MLRHSGMAVEGESPPTPVAVPKFARSPTSQASSSHPTPVPFPLLPPPSPLVPPTPQSRNTDTSPQKPPNSKSFILSVASNFSSQPLTNPDPKVWGVLTAISSNARRRAQGINMLLSEDELSIGRSVKDKHFQIDSTAVSGYHCKIYRKNITMEDGEHPSNCHACVFLKDTSTNGTYLNWKKLDKSFPEAQVHHGDIISFAAVPQHERSFAFVYREVRGSGTAVEGALGKRKSEEIFLENKRLKGIGIGASDGPLSLDDFRMLQRSNTELRKQLENHVLTIDTLRNDCQATFEHHENEKKQMKEAVAKLYIDELKQMQHLLDGKQKELMEANRLLAEKKHTIEDLNDRLVASQQSCIEANEIIKSHKASISVLESQLDDERDQRREERQTAVADMKAAIQRVQSEAQEEVSRLSSASLQHERELQDEINKLQEREKKWCLQVDALRPRLEDTRQQLVISDNKIRQLEAQVCQEQLISANGSKRIKELEQEAKRMRKELESEKAAREEAWAKVSSLEFEINAAVRDLEFERRRLKGARERIMLRETQLRSFYSTTEEISALFVKQQEQLKAMQRTLEDEEKYDGVAVENEMDTNEILNNRFMRTERMNRIPNGNRAESDSDTSSSLQRSNRKLGATSSEEASVTEKHDGGAIRSQGEDLATQEEEIASADQDPLPKGAFGSEINGVGAEPFPEGDDAIGTEQVHETESPETYGDRIVDLNQYRSFAGDPNGELVQKLCGGAPVFVPCNQARSSTVMEDDTEPVGTVRTSDLLASEVAGSWINSTAPSINDENDSPRSRNDEEGEEDDEENDGEKARVTETEDACGDDGARAKQGSPYVSNVTGRHNLATNWRKVEERDLISDSETEASDDESDDPWDDKI